MATSEVTIRHATLEDLEEIHSLLKRVDLPIDDVEAATLGGYVVAEAGNKIVGVAGMETYEPYALLRSVAVEPSFRGKGIADRLVSNRLTWISMKDYESVFLLTTTAETYFSRYGFSPVSRDIVPDSIRGSSEFSTVCPDTAVVMKIDTADWLARDRKASS